MENQQFPCLTLFCVHLRVVMQAFSLHRRPAGTIFAFQARCLGSNEVTKFFQDSPKMVQDGPK